MNVIMSFRSISFRGKVFFVLLTCSLMSLLVGFRISFNGFSQILESELSEKATIVTIQFAQQITDLLILEDEIALQKVGTQFYTHHQLKYIGIYDQDAFLIFHKSELSIKTEISPVDIEIKHIVKTVTGDEFLEVIYPVKLKNRNEGYIRVLFPRTQLAETKRTMFFSVFFIIAIMIVFITAVAYWGGFFLSKPMESIIESMNKVSGHNYSQKIEHLHIPEFDVMIDSYNDMMTQLNRSFTSLNDEIYNREKIELQLRNISDNLPNAVIYQMKTFPDGRRKYTHIGENIKQLCYILPSDVYRDSKAIYSLIDKAYTSELFAEEQNAVSKKHALYSEFLMLLPGGSKRWLSLSAHPKKLADGSTLWDGILFDITNRKLAEIELVKNKELLQHRNEAYEKLNYTLIATNESLNVAKEKAEESNRLKTAFLQNISHEVRTPLNAICGFSNLLDADLDEDQRTEYIEIIQKSSTQLLSIVTDILTISSIETNQITVTQTKVDVNDILNNLLMLFKNMADTKGVLLKCSSFLSEAETHIYIDKGKLIQILSNIIGNAIKFTHTGTVEYGCVRQQNELAFFVKDTGIGIGKEHQEKIFERFCQAGSNIQIDYGGTGLGLSIVKGLVDLLEGSVTVKSELSHGSVFTVIVPYKPVADERPVSDMNTLRSKKVVLVAEDEELNFRLVEVLLKRMDLDVLWSKNGKDAISMVENNPSIAIILMDIKMPIMDGFSAAKILKQKYPNMPIIAQSAYAMDYERSKYEAIFDGYITKPINEKLFKKEIAPFCE